MAVNSVQLDLLPLALDKTAKKQQAAHGQIQTIGQPDTGQSQPGRDRQQIANADADAPNADQGGIHGIIGIARTLQRIDHNLCQRRKRLEKRNKERSSFNRGSEPLYYRYL